MSEQKTEKKSLSKHDFYFETSLYEILAYSDLENKEDLLSADVDAYSAQNSTDTTYSVGFSWITKIETKYVNQFTQPARGFGVVTLKCKRKSNDVLRFFIYNDEIGRKMMKVGQWPSLADLQFAEIGKKYDKVLPEEDLKNLKKAIGLVAHGAGAGSFVYLRRIFENLIFETFTSNAHVVGIKEMDFKTKRMEDKVESLKAFLPSQLVEMRSIYGILSKGVHELTEEECLKYFGPLKLSIELILDQRIENVKKQQRDAAVKKQLQEIHQELANSNKKVSDNPPTVPPENA